MNTKQRIELILVLLMSLIISSCGSHFVSAYDYPFQSTGITVTTGDQIEFSASGKWDCGLGRTDLNGNDEMEPNSPAPNANLCALVGAIGVDTPNVGDGFFIGESNQITVTRSGTLYVGSNDNLGECVPGLPFSCYKDNKGTISVRISVKQP